MKRTMRWAWAAILTGALGVATAGAESTRELRAELTPGSQGFKVENLVGRMEIVPGGGSRVVVTATVHGESDRVAGMLRIDEVGDEDGRPTLRVVYPLDEYTTYQDPGRNGGWFGGNSSTSTKYAGRKVRVTSGGGVLLYADVRVEVPGSDWDGKFRNVAGNIKAENISGTSKFDTGSGEILLANVRGSVGADTGSGDIKATDIEGRFDADTGSGDVILTRFDGKSVSCDTGSGDVILNAVSADSIDADTGSGQIRASDVRARVVKVDTGSGGINVEGTGIESFDADTGSGDVYLDSDSAMLAHVSVDTGSGDVEIRMDANASFEAIADQSSGDIKNRFDGAEPIVRGREVIGYRRGDARTHIRVDTGSGNLTLAPR